METIIMPGSVTDAIILAAGDGTRFAKLSTLPKTLLPVAGVAPLDYIVRALADNGVRRVHIVVGHRRDVFFSHDFSAAPEIEVRWLQNLDYERPNGLSLLAAAGHVESPFLLLMSDHLFEPDTLTAFLAAPRPAGAGLLATDSQIDQVFDLDDATKVWTDGGELREIGKDLARFNAVDTGMFVLPNAIFPAMRQQVEAGSEQLSAGIAAMARLDAMRTWDIGGRRWIDIDTPEALAVADALAWKGCFGGLGRLSAPSAGTPPVRPPVGCQTGAPPIEPRLP
jgi:1L-myo-inositol 1-phosphate cytidylyltransferase